jgi:hypothetical protein
MNGSLVETEFLVSPAMIARAGQPIVSRAPQQRAERAQDAMRRCLDQKILQPATRAAERRKTERKSRQGCCKKSIGFESDACLRGSAISSFSPDRQSLALLPNSARMITEPTETPTAIPLNTPKRCPHCASAVAQKNAPFPNRKP